ncbi:MAG: GyrI-like domain-containing protein [Clostridiaceae bacterium]|nr:GyrI-like domain-containing protein [Clostridiaceae bacterium]
MAIELVSVNLPEQPVLFIRTHAAMADLPQTIGTSYHKIMSYMEKLAIEPSDAPYTAYYNLDMANLDVEMGFPTAKKMSGNDTVQSGVIPAGLAVTCLYKGSYQGMGPVYEAMNRWIAEHHYRPTGIAYEYYYNSPDEVPESELLTKVVLPYEL